MYELQKGLSLLQLFSDFNNFKATITIIRSFTYNDRWKNVWRLKNKTKIFKTFFLYSPALVCRVFSEGPGCPFQQLIISVPLWLENKSNNITHIQFIEFRQLWYKDSTPVVLHIFWETRRHLHFISLFITVMAHILEITKTKTCYEEHSRSLLWLDPL